MHQVNACFHEEAQYQGKNHHHNQYFLAVIAQLRKVKIVHRVYNV
jgi:hypothetical protein